jgi:hypothetical protein
LVRFFLFAHALPIPFFFLSWCFINLSRCRRGRERTVVFWSRQHGCIQQNGLFIVLPIIRWKLKYFSFHCGSTQDEINLWICDPGQVQCHFWYVEPVFIVLWCWFWGLGKQDVWRLCRYLLNRLESSLLLIVWEHKAAGWFWIWLPNLDKERQEVCSNIKNYLDDVPLVA